MIINQNENQHGATEPALSNSLVPQCPSALVTSKKVAFTLAEVLITLAIIGVVAVLTVPALIQNYNEKAWSTAQDVFTKRLEVATRQMNTEEKLAGYSSTMDFVNELKNKIKITKVCDSSELTKCFENTIHANYKDVDITEFQNAGQFTKENWGTETVGIQFANGVSALIAYNPNTEQDPYNNQFSATAASMAILYDVSGYKNPNTIGKDINMNGNVKALGCMIKPELLGGMCINQILGPQNGGYGPLTEAECEAQKGDLGISACNYDNDYWAGAVKACGGTSNMPTESQLKDLAKYVYNTDSITGGYGTTYATLDTTKASQFLSASSKSDRFYVWSDKEYHSYDAYARDFRATGTSGSNYFRYSSATLAVCLSD